jgi:hypothetical protein
MTMMKNTTTTSYYMCTAKFQVVDFHEIFVCCCGYNPWWVTFLELNINLLRAKFTEQWYTLVCFLLLGIHWKFIHLSVIWQLHSFFQNQYYSVLPISISRILLFPQGHPVAAYVIFFIFLSLLSFLQQHFVEDSSYTRHDHFTLCRILHSSLTLCNTLHISRDQPKWFPSFSSTTFRNFPGISHTLYELSKCKYVAFKPNCKSLFYQSIRKMKKVHISVWVIGWILPLF